eukprot:6476071-Amphidinium_carterae.1
MLTQGFEVKGTIIAGCALATTLMTLSLMPALSQLELAPMECRVVGYQVVDDLAAQALGKLDRVRRAMIDVGSRLLHSLHDLCYPIAEDKCVVVASSGALGKAVATSLGIQWCRSTTHLGTTTVCGRLRRVGKVRERRKKALRRLKRVISLRRAGAKPVRVLRAGPTA